MMKYILSLSFLLGAFAYAQAQSDWTLTKSDNDITAYTRLEEGHTLKTVRIEAIINSRVEKVVDLLTDHNRTSEWQSGLKTTRLLERFSESEFVIFYEVDLPWPMSDRDFKIHSQVIDESESSVRIKMRSADDYSYPESDDHIRMTELSGYWLVESIAENKVKLTYEFYSDPNGDVPELLINAFAQDTPYRNIQNLRKVLTQ